MSLTVIDTATPIKVTGTTSADTEIRPDMTYVKFVYWYKPTTVGHLLTLKDSAGNELVQGYCENANESQWFPVFLTCNGIHCDDMDSGSLYIYH